jgi:hypothetical protein
MLDVEVVKGTIGMVEKDDAIKERGGTPMAPRRGSRKIFPYEATVIAGKFLLPADLQRLHQFMLDSKTVHLGRDAAGRGSAMARTRLQAAAERSCVMDR